MKAELPKSRRGEFSKDMLVMTPRQLCKKYGLSDKVCYDWRRKIRDAAQEERESA